MWFGAGAADVLVELSGLALEYELRDSDRNGNGLLQASGADSMTSVVTSILVVLVTVERSVNANGFSIVGAGAWGCSLAKARSCARLLKITLPVATYIDRVNIMMTLPHGQLSVQS